MKLNTIAVLGGGPGGLYAARQLKRSHPHAQVTLYEQSEPDKTFGFGVGLSARTQRNLRAADAESLQAIIDVAYPHDMSMRVPSGEARIAHGELVAIARTRLLAILQEQAANAGVALEFGTRASADDIEADLIVAADGINSATRTAHAAEIKPEFTAGTGYYLWCGADFALPSALFTPVTTESGTFVAHAYPYTDDLSTFLIETDEATWRRAGFDATTADTGSHDTDAASLAYLEKAFAEPLAGHRLIGNRTRWLQFRTVTCGSWHTGNIVLLGDAAHTAHYSIGSGTKLAMEDAIALDSALLSAETLEEAFGEYEQTRRPAVEYLQEIATRSEAWWDSFPARMHLPAEQLMLAYMTRAGKVTVDRFVDSAPEVGRKGLAQFAGVDPLGVPVADIDEWVLGSPASVGGRDFESRSVTEALREQDGTLQVWFAGASPWGPDADQVVRDIAGASGTERFIWLEGPDRRVDVLNRLDLAERIRFDTSAVVAVDLPESARAEAVGALASARTDLVHFHREASSAAAV